MEVFEKSRTAMKKSIKNAYGKDVSVFKERSCDSKGNLTSATCNIVSSKAKVTIKECFTTEEDTDCVEVTFGNDVKMFYQGEWAEDKPGTEDDYHGLNAYFQAETYAMGLI